MYRIITSNLKASFSIFIIITLLLTAAVIHQVANGTSNVISQPSEIVAVVVDNNMSNGKTRVMVVYETDNFTEFKSGENAEFTLIDNTNNRSWSGRTTMYMVYNGDYTNGVTRKELRNKEDK